MTAPAGWFEVSGRSAHLRVEPGGWLVGTAPTGRDALALLREQPDFRTPTKALSTGRLRAEVPLGPDLGASFLVVHAALESSLRSLGGLEPKPAGAVPAEERAMSLLESSGYELTRDGDLLVATLDCEARSPKTARVEIEGDAWIARAELVPLRDASPASLEALEHFLLAVNGGLRFARGSILRDAAVLEVCYPVESLSEDVVHKALGALTVGVDWAHRECRALVDAGLADRYLSFHEPHKPRRKST